MPKEARMFMKLLDYIRGIRKGKDAHRLEKESMQDPFLADALDGYLEVEGDHEAQIQKLQERVQLASTPKRNLRPLYWGVAACLVIGISVSSYFLLLNQESDSEELIAMETTTVSDYASEEVDTSSDSSAIKSTPVISSKDIVAKVQESPKEEVSVAEIAEDKAMLAEDEFAPESIRSLTQEAAPVVATEPQKIMQVRSLAATPLIEGKITDSHGLPLSGVAVSYKGTSIQTLTNKEGRFALAKNDTNNQLAAQFKGYEAVDIKLDTMRPILIAMNELGEKLNQPVKSEFKRAQTALSGQVAVSEEQRGGSSSMPIIGEEAYKAYLEKQMVRPTDEACKDMKGEVILSFYISEKGRPERITIEKSLCESADKEAVRLIEEGSDWTQSDQIVKIAVKF